MKCLTAYGLGKHLTELKSYQRKLDPMKKTDKEDLIIQHLEYIRSRVDQINGRVRDNEKSISWIKGIGLTVSTIILAIIGIFIKE